MRALISLFPQYWLHRAMAFWLAFGLLLMALLPACNAPVAGASVAVAAAPLQESPRPTFVLAGPDATATPTPFQPLPPTPLPEGVFLPDATRSLPVVTPLPTMTPSPVAELPAAPTAPASTLALPTAPPEAGEIPEQINVLLLGADRRPWDQQFRTDTILLLTINSREGSVNILSFPRDLYVTIPGFGSSRINTAWTYGGYPLLEQTLKQNFGLNIDYYALVEFSAFKRIIDGLNGLTVNVAEPVSDYRAGYWITVPAGSQEMDADMVLWYVRTRKTTNDIARNRRQQEVLMALADKLISLDALRRAPDFYAIYKDSVTTDIDLLDVLSWLPVAAKVAETRNIRQYYITYHHVYDSITPEGAMVLVPQQDAIMNVIRKSQNLP